MADINRTRSRSLTINGSTVVTERMQDVSRPKPNRLGWNQLQVSKSSVRSVHVPSLGQHVFRSATTNLDFLSSYSSFKIPQLLSYADVQFDFTKNNSFEILPFVYELDETIAMFCLDFFKNFSYGAYNWGLNPLIADLKGLFATLTDLFGGIDLEKELNNFTKFPQSWNIHPPYPISLPNYGVSGVSVGLLAGDFEVITWGGISCEIPQIDPLLLSAQIFLEEIGFHPDLLTIWSLTPLSFVLDYFLPIADLIERIHPRSWFNPKFCIGGPFVIKGRNLVVQRRETFYSKVYQYPHFTDCFYQYRSKENEKAVAVGKIPPVTWNAPSLLQVFNTSYIANAMLQSPKR